MSDGRHVLLAVAVAVLVGVLPAAATGDDAYEPPATTVVDDVRQTRVPSGAPALLDWVATHEVTAEMGQDERLPTVRIDRADHPEAFDGVWGQFGSVGAWLAPSGTAQFWHDIELFENAWYRTRMSPWPNDPVLAQPGDRAEVAAGIIPFGPLLPWDAERADTADGELGWEVAASHRELSASYGGVEATMDALFIRAHVVARGGDVDARPQSQRMPPLEIDLPRSYPTRVAASGNLSITTPYVQYVKSTDLRVVPPLGKAVLQASVQGYFPEGQVHTEPGGAAIADWHVPINIVMVIPRDEDLPIEPRAVTTMPAGGLVVPAGGGAPQAVAPGGRAELSASRLTVHGGDPTLEPPADGGSWLVDEARVAASVNRSLAEPRTVGVHRGGGYQATLDPDYRGSGVLALRDVRWGPHPAPYVDTTAVAAVVVDSKVVPLTRDRLVDLAVVPGYPRLSIRSVGGSEDEVVRQVRMRESWVFHPGLLVRAVYDLGDDVHATVTYELGPSPTAAGGNLYAGVHVGALSGAPLQAAVLRYSELPGGEGALRNAGADQPVEFTSTSTSVGLGQRSVSHGAGTLAVVRAPGPLFALPSPDPDILIEDQRVALVYLSRTSEQPVPTASFWGRTWLGAAPALPATEPPPLGEPCGSPQIEGDDGPLAHPHMDVDAMWFDADQASLYVNLRLTQMPASAPAMQSYLYRIYWRHEHHNRYAAAVLDDDGAWTFEAGVYTTSLGHTPRAGATGEVQAGPDGVLRIAVPRDLTDRLRDGELLRDTSVHAYHQAGGNGVRLAQAPAGSSVEYGSGGDYVIGRC